MGLKFSPPKNVARYAYAIEYTNSQGKFKTYDNIASAKLGLRAKTQYRANDFKAAFLLENIDGEWYVLHTFNNGDEHYPWEKQVEVGGWSRSYKMWRGVPMSRDEYAEWRVAVERERIADLSADFSLNP